jgi:branched-subunit amino acid ABC-type transport system permease component
MVRVYEAGGIANVPVPLLIVMTILVAMLVSGALAAFVERVAYRPLRNAPRLVPLITAIGISFILQDAVRAFQAVSRNDFNLTYPVDEVAWLGDNTKLSFSGAVSGGFNIGGTTTNEFVIDGQPLTSFSLDEVEAPVERVTVGGITFGGVPVEPRDVRVNDDRPDAIVIGGQDLETIDDAAIVVNVRHTSLLIIGSAVLMLLALNYFVNGTKTGRGIRAISQDQPTAGLMGINVNRMISITFFIGGALGGLAGALYGMNVGTITPYVGFIPGLKAFTAAVLGGIGNVTGALLGGLTLGLIEAFLNGTLVYFPALGQRYTDVFVFLVLILILIFRPAGILGERVDEKV